jgi:lysophospholipid acyltransferase (LPLAT)-like uncharacterized protein
VARAVLGWILGALAWAWLRTLRLTVFTDPDLPADRPWVLVFFHGTQFPLLAWKRRRLTAVMVSHSKDGALQARALTVLGFDVVRGSSSRGGARALAAITKRLRNRTERRDAAFAVDGPRGPYGVVKPGALLAAASTGAVLVPMGSAIAGGWVLRHAWDRFALPAPFGRAAVVVGPAVAGDAGEVERSIVQANARAEALLAAPDAYMVASAPIE